MRAGLPWHPSSNDALESFHRGCPSAAQQVSIVPQKESLKGAFHNSQRGKTSMALRLCSLHEGAVIHRLQPEPTNLVSARKLVRGGYVKSLGEYFRGPVPLSHSKAPMDTNTH